VRADRRPGESTTRRDWRLATSATLATGRVETYLRYRGGLPQTTMPDMARVCLAGRDRVFIDKLSGGRARRRELDKSCSQPAAPPTGSSSLRWTVRAPATTVTLRTLRVHLRRLLALCPRPARRCAGVDRTGAGGWRRGLGLCCRLRLGRGSCAFGALCATPGSLFARRRIAAVGPVLDPGVGDHPLVCGRRRGSLGGRRGRGACRPRRDPARAPLQSNLRPRTIPGLAGVASWSRHLSTSSL
jgi:hypothetical protein